MKRKLSEIDLAFIDIESTGLDFDKHEIIEIAVIVYNQKEEKIIKEWEIKIAPQSIEDASEKALQLNGYITNQHLYKSSLKSALIKFNSIVKDCIVVGQNISFDVRFIEKEMSKLNIEPSYDHRKLDMMSMSWFHVNETDIPGLSLKKLCDHFNVCNVGEHTALVDCYRTLELYGVLKRLVNDSIK
jgi:DNA polymerase-3 subunit epsilon